MAKTPKLDDGRIVALIDYGVSLSVGFSESILSKERERVQLYYDGELPRKQGKGDSGYNSRDVFDSVEDMKAQLLDTFSANKRPVKFDAARGEPDRAAEIRTDYVTDVIFNQNDGYHLFEETIHEALMARNAIAKVWWEPEIKTEYYHMTKTTLEEVQAYIMQHPKESPEVTDVTLHEDGQSIELATLRLKRDASQVRIEMIPPEEFGVTPMTKGLSTTEMCFHRREMTVSDLLKAGYSKSVVEDLQSDDRLWMAMEPEKIARFQPTDDLIGTHALEDGQAARRSIMVYEAYLELDLEDDDEAGVSQLFKVVKVGNTILEKEPVERRPFISFCPLPRPAAFWGTNFAELIIGTQNARSYLTRSIIRHSLITNNPRMMVVRGALMNPKELSENRFGGIVNVSRPDGLIPLPQASLNPFVFQTIQMLKTDKEEKTGISSLSQGLDKDALSKQNSGDMVHELITVSQLRQKVIARNFAENFLRDLYTEVYKLVLENEPRQKIVKVAGGWEPVDLSQWPDEARLSVSFSLGYGEQEKDAAMWAAVHKSLESMPALAANYGPQQQYNVAIKGLESLGITNTGAVLAPMSANLPKPPPNPLQQAEIAMKQADAAVKNATAQQIVQQLKLEEQKIASQERIEMARIQLESKKIDAKIALDQDALAHKVAVDAAEIKLQDEAQQTDKLTAEAMPTH